MPFDEVVIGEVQSYRSLKVSSFFEKASVKRVRRRMCSRVVAFSRST